MEHFDAVGAILFVDRAKFGEPPMKKEDARDILVGRRYCDEMQFDLIWDSHDKPYSEPKEAESLIKAVELTEEQSKRFKVSWAKNVWQKSEPLDFLVDGLITRGSVNLFVGEGGSKKTWATLDLAVCAALGKNWLNFPLKQTPVLFVDEESGERRLHRRLYETLRGHDVAKETEVPIALTSLSMLNLRNLDDVNALHIIIEQTGAGLVIIDALADVTAGADENSVKDMQPLFMNLRRVAETTKAAIIVIHHSNKQNGYRGSTAIKGAVDLMLMVESQADSPYIKFRAEKSRDIEPKSFTAFAHFQPQDEKFCMTSADESELASTNMSKTQEAILEYLFTHGNSAILDITNCDEIGSSPSTIKDVCYQLIDSKHIERTNDGGRGKKAVVNLTVLGRGLAERIVARRNGGQAEFPDFVK